MKFKEFLKESPVTLDATGSDIFNYVPSYKEVVAKLKRKVGFIREYDMLSDGRSYALVDKENEKVAAYSRISVQYVPRSKIKERNKQSLLWKNNTITSSEIRYMFLQALDDHGLIFSDDMQTAGGKSFWKSMYNDYKGSRYYEVGYYDELNDMFVPFLKDDGDEEFEQHYKDDSYTVLYIRMKK